jgi:hypothetical protein
MYGAAATPDVFVIDRTGIVRYHGAPDAAHDDPSLDAMWLRDALEDVVAGRDVRLPATAAVGCSIKWRAELLWWQGCPSHGDAERLLRAVLDDAGRGEVPIVRREVRTMDQARELAFPGSPTFRIGGRDLYPTDAQHALTCRIYDNAAGGKGPLPETAALALRVRAATMRPWELPGWIDPRSSSS